LIRGGRERDAICERDQVDAWITNNGREHVGLRPKSQMPNKRISTKGNTKTNSMVATPLRKSRLALRIFMGILLIKP
jgi:hypothetical protein